MFSRFFPLDLKKLQQLLRDAHIELSRWDVYEAELESGCLRWGVVHTEDFFRDNVGKMEVKSFTPVQRLLQLIRNHVIDEEVATVALYDLGEFIRFYPNGKLVARRLGARELVLPLIEHENHDLQHQAVTCLSKMLVENWAALR